MNPGALAHLLIGAAAFFASALTFLSGFGLGTLLLPVFALFFPVEAAVGLTAAVHLINNLFKLALVGGQADRGVVLAFGVPAVFSAVLGARALIWLSGLGPLAAYQAFGRDFEIMPVKFLIGVLMICFALQELAPAPERLPLDRKYLPWGGILSGFFGGLSGHQGALRGAFLLRCGLSKEGYVASGAVIACLVDLTRLGVYAANFSAAGIGANAALLAWAAASACLGAWAGNRLLRQTTMNTVRAIAAAMLLLIAAGLAAGII